MFSVDKRYWPEIGIVTIFFVNKSNDLHWCFYKVYIEALCHIQPEVFLQRLTVVAVPTFCYFVCFPVTEVWLRPRLEVYTSWCKARPRRDNVRLV